VGMIDSNIRTRMGMSVSSARFRERESTSYPPESGRRTLLPEEAFLRILSIERKRAERSDRSFLLIVLDAEELFQQTSATLPRVLSALCSSIRETDIIGWQRTSSAIGIILTETGTADKRSIRAAVLTSLTTALREKVNPKHVDLIRISFHFFPDDHDHDNHSEGGSSADKKLYPDLQSEERTKRVPRLVKRATDVAGSLAALIVLSPVFAVIAAVIRLTSKGPVIFRQVRVGQFGKRFIFLKFRSMRAHSDPRIHQEFMSRFIGAAGNGSKNGKINSGECKMTNDPRVTAVGKFLRKTSLDELPQFWNVLTGDMSLVGPRPPIPYELKNYKTWHKRRVLEVKPGITGLWQVRGRSRTSFDELVRLDLKYARTWSLWLDLKILFQTPQAVISGEGAR